MLSNSRVNIGLDDQLVELGYNKDDTIYKNLIDDINPNVWKKMRWYVNLYDFNIIEPIINRAFYKFWEIINKFKLYDDYDPVEDLIFHCAEAPGGFIQGTNRFLKFEDDYDKESLVDGFQSVIKKSNKKKIKVYTMSIKTSKKSNLPEYNRKIIQKHVKIFYGEDGKGDVTNYMNILALSKIVKKNFYLVTADGGFDEEGDYNHKEQLHYTLIFNEILAAIKLLKKDGHFVIKMFDIYTKSSLHILYLLYKTFDEFYIYKPETSRPTNSEKYIICKYFNLENKQQDELVEQMISISKTLKEYTQNNKYVIVSLFDSVEKSFINDIRKFNEEHNAIQSKFLIQTINLCQINLKNVKDDVLKNKILRKETFEEWCAKYNLTLT